jgi:hypothetical protein
MNQTSPQYSRSSLPPAGLTTPRAKYGPSGTRIPLAPRIQTPVGAGLAPALAIIPPPPAAIVRAAAPETCGRPRAVAPTRSPRSPAYLPHSHHHRPPDTHKRTLLRHYITDRPPPPTRPTRTPRRRQDAAAKHGCKAARNDGLMMPYCGITANFNTRQA